MFLAGDITHERVPELCFHHHRVQRGQHQQRQQRDGDQATDDHAGDRGDQRGNAGACTRMEPRDFGLQRAGTGAGVCAAASASAASASLSDDSPTREPRARLVANARAAASRRAVIDIGAAEQGRVGKERAAGGKPGRCGGLLPPGRQPRPDLGDRIVEA